MTGKCGAGKKTFETQVISDFGQFVLVLNQTFFRYVSLLGSMLGFVSSSFDCRMIDLGTSWDILRHPGRPAKVYGILPYTCRLTQDCPINSLIWQGGTAYFSCM